MLWEPPCLLVIVSRLCPSDLVSRAFSLGQQRHGNLLEVRAKLLQHANRRFETKLDLRTQCIEEKLLGNTQSEPARAPQSPGGRLRFILAADGYRSEQKSGILHRARHRPDDIKGLRQGNHVLRIHAADSWLEPYNAAKRSRN